LTITLTATNTPSHIPTQTPTSTTTSIPNEYYLRVTAETSCYGWEVTARTSPGGANLVFAPSKADKWQGEYLVEIVATAVWPDGTIKTDQILIHRPDRCIESTPTTTPIVTIAPTITFTPPPTQDMSGEGCTASYWRNHLKAWEGTGYHPDDDFDTVFGVDLFSPDITLHEALKLFDDGQDRFIRQGTAGLLNAAHPEVHFWLSVPQVVEALQSGHSNMFSEYDELVCPLR
jgi:hypothetical protein